MPAPAARRLALAAVPAVLACALAAPPAAAAVPEPAPTVSSGIVAGAPGAGVPDAGAPEPVGELAPAAQVAPEAASSLTDRGRGPLVAVGLAVLALVGAFVAGLSRRPEPVD